MSGGRRGREEAGGRALPAGRVRVCTGGLRSPLALPAAGFSLLCICLP